MAGVSSPYPSGIGRPTSKGGGSVRHGELGAISAAWCAAFGGTAFAVRHSRRPRPLLAAAHLLPLTPRPCGRASGRQAPHQWVGAAEPILQTNPRQHPRFDPCCSETREVNSRTAAGCGCRSGSCLAEPRINSGEGGAALGAISKWPIYQRMECSRSRRACPR
jgi:hypothetical protein